MACMPYKIKYGNKIIEVPKISDITWGNVLNKPASFPTSWGNISGKPSTYNPSSHTHDDRYYTESEINSKLSTKQDKVSDSGWVRCSMGYGISAFSSDSDAPRVRKIGNIVCLNGCVKNSTTWTSHDTIITIPAGYRPTVSSVVYVEQGSGSNRYCIRIQSSGAVLAERYSNNTNTSNTVPIGAWLNLFACWMV